MNYLKKRKRIKRKLSHNEVILIHICNSYRKKLANQLTIYTNNEDGN
jgi:hypothetical protein